MKNFGNVLLVILFAGALNHVRAQVYLPLKIYYSPSPQLDSHVFGVMLGFTIARPSVR